VFVVNSCFYLIPIWTNGNILIAHLVMELFSPLVKKT